MPRNPQAYPLSAHRCPHACIACLLNRVGVESCVVFALPFPPTEASEEYAGMDLPLPVVVSLFSGFICRARTVAYRLPRPPAHVRVAEGQGNQFATRVRVRFVVPYDKFIRQGPHHHSSMDNMMPGIGSEWLLSTVLV